MRSTSRSHPTDQVSDERNACAAATDAPPVTEAIPYTCTTRVIPLPTTRGLEQAADDVEGRGDVEDGAGARRFA